MSSLELACKPLFDGYLPVISDDLELQYSKHIHGLLPQSPKQETGTKLVFTDHVLANFSKRSRQLKESLLLLTYWSVYIYALVSLAVSLVALKT